MLRFYYVNKAPFLTIGYPGPYITEYTYFQPKGDFFVTLEGILTFKGP
ncbi:hypothetical protein J2T02_003367 [Chitinophaga terrae (ex Kim and Jung 2007)]|nr:hypothetical protein [Chitinophaga terrae (ex Kim and Jung 2007)]